MLLALLLSACSREAGLEAELPLSRDEVRPTRKPTAADLAEAAALPMPSPAPAPARLGTPATSLAARPAWDEGPGYAPPSVATLAEAPAEGALREGMVRCLVRSDLRESRLRARAALPDLQGVLRLGSTEQAAVGPDHEDTLLFTAPLVRLDPGDAIELVISDRQAFGTRTLGTLSAPYRALPVELQGPGLQARCAWVPREELERALERPLDEAYANLQGWRPAPRLSDASLEPPAPAQAARSALREAAALVGWDDPRVGPLVRAWDARLALHEQLLAAEVQARRAELPTGSSSPAPGLTWAPGWLAHQDPALESWPHRSWGLRLPVRLDPGQSAFGPVLGPVRDPVLIDARGRRFPVEVEMGQPDGFQGELLLLGGGPGEAEEPAMPALLRAQGPQGWVFSRVDAAPAGSP